MTQENNQNPTSQAGLPLFYVQPQPLSHKLHTTLGVLPKTHYKFAAKTNSIPLTVAEFSDAAKNYPIVFIKDKAKAALVVTGFRDNENVFINNAGDWMEEAYVPAYVHRYPFIFLEDTDNDQFVLCIDRASDFVKEGEGTFLFKEGGKPSEMADKALKACGDFQGYLARTREFVEALDEQELLVQNQAEMKGENGNLNLTGFYVIDEKKFRDLPEDIILDWHKKGWLYFAYAHFLSLANWNRVANLTQQKLGPQETEKATS